MSLNELKGREDEDIYAGSEERYKEVKPVNFMKIFRALLADERSPVVAKKILMDVAKKNGGREGVYDMFMKRPASLSRILENKTIDGTIVDRLRVKLYKWIVDEERHKRLMIAATLIVQTKVRSMLAKARYKILKRKSARDALEYRSATRIQKIIRGILSSRRYEDYKQEAFFQQPKKRISKFLEIAKVTKIFFQNNDPKKGMREVMLVQPQWGGGVIGATVDPEADCYDFKKVKMMLSDDHTVVIQHYGISNDRVGRLEPRVVCYYQEGMVVPGPPFWWPLTWQRYLRMSQEGKKPGQQKEERVGVFQQWEAAKTFILTKEPRWLGGALVRYLRGRGELPAEDHDVAKAEKRARAKAAREEARHKRHVGKKSYLDMTLTEEEKLDNPEMIHPERDSHYGLPKTLTRFQFPRVNRGLRIVFLEDDGVLCTDESPPGSMEDEYIDRLRTIYLATGCYFVCCSPRRASPDMMKEMIDRFLLEGIPAHHFLGGTPVLPGNKNVMWRRVDECLMWVKDQIFMTIESWIIIDKIDLSRFNPPCDLKKHWVRTNLRKALNQERCMEAIRLLLLPVSERKEILETKLHQEKRKFKEDVWAALEVEYKEKSPFSNTLKETEKTSLLHYFKDLFVGLVDKLEEMLENYEILKSYIASDPFLKTDFEILRSEFPKLIAQMNKVVRTLQIMENDKIKAIKVKEEKDCYALGGRKCTRLGCHGLCYPTKSVTGKKHDYLTCLMQNCGAKFCRLCGVISSPIEIHGRHRHLEVCEFWREQMKGDVSSPYFTEQDTDVRQGKIVAGTIKCINCAAELKERGVKKMQVACKCITSMPKSWFETRHCPPEVKGMSNKLRTWLSQQNFGKK